MHSWVTLQCLLQDSVVASMCRGIIYDLWGNETIRMIWLYFFTSDTSTALKKSSRCLRLSFDKDTIFSTCLERTTTVRRPEPVGGLH